MLLRYPLFFDGLHTDDGWRRVPKGRTALFTLRGTR